MSTAKTPRVLLETNVVLDVLLQREPWLADAQAIWQAVDDGRLAIAGSDWGAPQNLGDSARSRRDIVMLSLCLDRGMTRGSGQQARQPNCG